MNRTLIMLILFLAALGISTYLSFCGEGEEFLQEIEVLEQTQKRSVPARDRGRRDRSDPASTAAGHAKLRQSLSISEFKTTEGLDESNSTLISVVDGETKIGLASAIVSVVEWEVFSRTGGAYQLILDPLGYLQRHGQHFRTDERGEVRIPDRLDQCTVTAFHGDQFGKSKLSYPGPVSLVVDVHPIKQLRVRVTSQVGKPVLGAELVFRRLTKKSYTRSPSAEDLNVVTTNRLGIAVLRIDPADLRKSVKEDGQVTYEVRFFGALAKNVAVKIDPENFPDDLIEMTMPTSTPIRLRFLDPEGRVCTDPLVFSLVHEYQATSTKGVLPKTDFLLRKFVNRGVTEILAASCGISIRVTASVLGSHFRRTFKVIDIPDQPGSPKQYDIPFTSSYPIIRGRLLDPEDQVFKLSKFEFAAVAMSERGVFIRQKVLRKTDENGFSEVQNFSKKLSTKVNFWIEVTQGPLKAPLRLVKAFDFEKRDGDVDLGDLVLNKAPLVISGQTVDENGSPVASARLRLDSLKQFRSGGADDLQDVVLRSKTTGLSDRFGRFAFYGVNRTRDVIGKVEKEGFLAERFKASPRTEDQLIVLNRVSRFQGRLILTNGSSPEGLMVEANHVDSLLRSRSTVSGNEHFVSSDLKAGRYKLRVYDPRYPKRPLLQNFEFVLGAGEIRNLGDVAVSFEGARIDLHRMDPSAPEVGVYVVAKVAGGKRVLSQFMMMKKKETLFLETDVCDLHLTANGYRQEVISQVTSGPCEIRMRKGIPVRFQFVNPQDVPRGYEVEFHVDPKLGTGFFWLNGVVGKKAQSFHSPGIYRMKATICHSSDRANTVDLNLIEESIHVKDKTIDQYFDLEIRPQEIKSAIGRLGK